MCCGECLASIGSLLRFSTFELLALELVKHLRVKMSLNVV
jgi:hypothetical protein